MSSLAELRAAIATGDDRRAEAASQAAANSPGVLGEIEPLLRSEDADLRWWAVRMLALIEAPAARAARRQALQDADATVRQCAALALRQHPDPAAIPELCAALGSADALLARLAGDALASSSASAIPALVECLDAEPAVRIGAVRALALMRTPEAISALYAALENASSLVEYWAEHGLAELGVGMVFFNP